MIVLFITLIGVAILGYGLWKLMDYVGIDVSTPTHLHYWADVIKEQDEKDHPIVDIHGDILRDLEDL